MTALLAVLVRIWWLFPMLGLGAWGSFEHLRYDDARIGNAKLEAKQAQVVQAAKDAAAAKQEQAAKAARDTENDLKAQLSTARSGLDAATQRLRYYAARSSGSVSSPAQAAGAAPGASQEPTAAVAADIVRQHEEACEYNTAIAQAWQEWWKEVSH